MNTSSHRRIAIALAFAGALPSPLPLAWIHKFYLGQYLWGVVYLLLSPTLLPQAACALEGIWFLSQSNDRFVNRFPTAHAPLAAVANSTWTVVSRQGDTSAPVTNQVVEALRDLEQLRQEGLVTEYEFEQKRRKLIDKIG